MGRPSKDRRIKPDGLPENVTAFLDRHGKRRLRFRKTGLETHYFQARYPSRDFWEEYDACLSGEPKKRVVGVDRVRPGTVHDLMNQYLSVPSRLGPSAVTQAKVRSILENDFRLFVTPSGDIVGNKLVRECTFEPLDFIIQAKAAAAPWQAKKLRRHLRKFFAFCKKARAIEENPIDDTELVKAKKSKGYHSWTEAEIGKFVARHPIGSKAYLALMLFLWTFQRRGDVTRMCPKDILSGDIAVHQTKGDKTLSIWLVGPLLDAIAATPRPESATDDMPFLLTSFRKPFSPKGFGNWFRLRCDEAGLPNCSAHGLRKAASRRAAEANLSNQSIKSATGHVRDDEVALYTAAVEQRRLNRHAMETLADNLANLENKVAK